MRRLSITLPVTPPMVVVYLIAVFCMGAGAERIAHAVAQWALLP